MPKTFIAQTHIYIHIYVYVYTIVIYAIHTHLCSIYIILAVDILYIVGLIIMDIAHSTIYLFE